MFVVDFFRCVRILTSAFIAEHILRLKLGNTVVVVLKFLLPSEYEL